MSGYIPPGYATIRDAVTKLADAWHPKLNTMARAAEHSSADPVIASLAASFAARREMVEGPRRALQERLETCRRVRQALAEGLLPSIIIAQDTGQRWRVPPSFWASKQADNDVTASGTVSLHMNGVPILGTPLVEDRDVRAIAVGETPPSLAESVARSTAPAKAIYQPPPQAMPLPKKKDRAVQRNRVKGEMKAAI